LSFGVAIEDRSLRVPEVDPAARFVVLVSEGKGAREIWSRELRPVERPEDRGWHDVEVVLGDLSGSTVDLLLVTESADRVHGVWTAWSDPVLRSEHVAPSPASRMIVETDLLDEAVPAEVARRETSSREDCRQRWTLEVPEEAVLDFAGQVLSNQDAPEGSIGPVELGLRIGGMTVYERRVSSAESIITLTGAVSLDPWAGDTVDLEFELCDVGAGNAMVWTKRLWLARAEDVPRSSSDAGPNLLLVMVDTLRADHLGLYGYERDTSPTLERLAQESRVFDRAISQSSWTLPAVASLLTGDTPPEHGVIEGVPLKTPTSTIGERLQAEGFTTFGFSANPLVGRLEAMHRGFEAFVQVPFAPAELVNRMFLDWLVENDENRWFSYLHYIDPHSPYAAPPPWNERYTEGCRTPFTRGFELQELSDAVNFGKGSVEYSSDDIDCLVNGYDGEIRYWDDQFGRLLASLEERGLLEDTIVVVTSDHGEEFLEHQRLGHGYHLYEESVRVPLLIRAPGRLEPVRHSAPVESRHLKEAVLFLLGLAPTGTDGGPLLTESFERDWRVFSHTTESWVIGEGYTTLGAVRGPRWSYILRPGDGADELYDREVDPEERTDRSEENPEVRSEYREALEQWMSRGTPHSETRGLDDQTLERLRALGYIR
jgi:arylsulfatase A-like enzyme